MNRKTTSYYANVRPEMTDFIRNTPTRVLEVGCGEGMFRKNFAMKQNIGELNHVFTQ